MGSDDEGMTNVRTIDQLIKIGSGECVNVTKIGDKHIKVIQEEWFKVEHCAQRLYGGAEAMD
jgi:hypothetical protein